MGSSARAQLVSNLLMLIELTAFGERVAPMGLDRWALDCATRALGLDIPLLRPHAPRLREGLRAARAWQREGGDRLAREAFDRGVYAATSAQTELAQARVAKQAAGELWRARRVVDAVVAALACVAGEREHEVAALAAREAFVGEDALAEDARQARRLLLRVGLLPTGADLLVRLDYAESRGLLPNDADARSWLDHHRQLLIAEDEDGRLAVVIRHLERVFSPELEAL